MSCHALLQGSNLSLLCLFRCRWILNPLSHLGSALPIIALNVNELNAPVKTHSVANEIFKVRIHLFAAYGRLASEIKRHTY